MKLLEVMHAKFACQFTDSLTQITHGLQTITTLGKDVFITDHLETPRVEATMKIETGTAEDEPKSVNEKKQRERNNEVEAIGHYAGGSETSIPKDHKTSLRELFQTTRTTEEKPQPLLKKKRILKRRMIQPSSKHCTVAREGTICSASADEKLHKILRMLHRVHPEALAISQKSQNLWKYVTKRNCTNEGYSKRNQMLTEDIIIFPYRAISEKRENHTNKNMSNHLTCSGGSDREFWIKSDAEYLILEL